MTFGALSNRFTEQLTQNGAGAVFDALVDGSSTALYWEIRPTSPEIYLLDRLIVYIEDGGNVRADRYGAAAALTNGILVQRVSGSGASATIKDHYVRAAKPIKTGGEWCLGCYDSEPIAGLATGNTVWRVRWSFSKTQSIRLDGSNDEAFRIVLQDNFGVGGAALVQHFFSAEGRKTGDQ